jgi:hypothetical protein
MLFWIDVKHKLMLRHSQGQSRFKPGHLVVGEEGGSRENENGSLNGERDWKWRGIEKEDTDWWEKQDLGSEKFEDWRVGLKRGDSRKQKCGGGLGVRVIGDRSRVRWPFEGDGILTGRELRGLKNGGTEPGRNLCGRGHWKDGEIRGWSEIEKGEIEVKGTKGVGK